MQSAFVASRVGVDTGDGDESIGIIRSIVMESLSQLFTRRREIPFELPSRGVFKV